MEGDWSNPLWLTSIDPAPPYDVIPRGYDVTPGEEDTEGLGSFFRMTLKETAKGREGGRKGRASDRGEWEEGIKDKRGSKRDGR